MTVGELRRYLEGLELADDWQFVIADDPEYRSLDIELHDDIEYNMVLHIRSGTDGAPYLALLPRGR